MSEKANEQSDHFLLQTERLKRYARLIEQQTGRAIRPVRLDGYVNLINRYGTEKDVTEHYQFRSEPAVPDETLTEFYEGNGLFAKIIDAPAEEAVKHGFTLENVKDQKLIDFYQEALEELDWDETAINALRWARLFGGSIAVMLINDGRGIDEPLDWKNIQSIDDIRVYDRSVIQPDYTTMFTYSPEDPFRTRGSRLGVPEYYHVYSKYGAFTVHDSRCLTFHNGVLPENCSNSIYELWGMPEYVRIKRAIRDSELAHSNGPKLLEKSVQAVYRMRDLAAELATDEGESRVLRRLQVIDMARGMLNSIAIDSENEDYDFKSFQFTGVSEIIDTTCNQLSALTSIPQTILFGRSPAGMNSTGESDMENWYNFVGRIQKRMLKSNLRYLLSVIFQAGVSTGEVDEVPKIKPVFNPLWSLSELEQATLEQTKANTQQVKANTAQTYVNMQVIDPSEVRKKLSETEDFDVENMLDDMDEEDLFAELEMGQGSSDAPGFEGSGLEPLTSKSVEELTGRTGNSPDAAPAATKLPQDMTDVEELQKAAQGLPNCNIDEKDTTHPDNANPLSVGVIVISEGKVLTGTRHNDFGYGLVCGPGGHIEEGETPEEAAIRETEEEFGITPTELIPLGLGPVEEDTGLTPHIFLCTEYDGTPNNLDLEMVDVQFRTLGEIEDMTDRLFQPFADSLDILKDCLGDIIAMDGFSTRNTPSDDDNNDGGPGSGNHGHKGVPGEVGGSMPNGGDANLPNLTNEERCKVLQKTGIGTTIKIKKKNGETILFTKIGDNSWEKDGVRPGIVFNDRGVGLNCWKSEVEVRSQQPKTESEIKVINSQKSEESLEKKKSSLEEKPTLTGKYGELQKRAEDISSSGMSKEEKAERYKQLIEELKPGTTFKASSSEFRKGPDPDYPYQLLSNDGNVVGEYKNIDFDIENYADKKNCIEFFDKESQLEERRQKLSSMKKSGKFNTSDQVHGERDGKISLSSGNFGDAGDYVVYRSGKIGSSGMIFFSPKKEGADQYHEPERGNTGEYEVHLKKPLVISGATDVECVRKAYNELHPDKPFMGDMTSSKWISLDKKNASALNSETTGYDSIIYILRGKPHEVQVSAKKAKKDVKKTGEYTVTDWSKTGNTYEEAVMKGYIDESAEDYRQVDLRDDGFGEDDSLYLKKIYERKLKNENSGSMFQKYLFGVDGKMIAPFSIVTEDATEKNDGGPGSGHPYDYYFEFSEGSIF